MPSIPYHTPLFPTISPSQILRRKPQPRPARRVFENHKLRLEEHIPEDGLPDAGITLQAAEAARAVHGRIVQITARHDGRIPFNLEREIGQGGAAREDVTAVGLAVGGTLDLSVIGGDDVVGEEQERGARVGDGGDGFRHGGRGADLVAAAGEAPEPLRVVDGGVGDVARVLAVVDVAEVVTTRGALLQVGGEERAVEATLGVGEEGLLLIRLDGVDGAEGEPEEAVALVLRELRADGFGELDGLARDGGATYVDDVGVDVAAGGAAVSVANAPGRAGADLGG